MGGPKRSSVDVLLEKVAPFSTWMLILFPIWGGYIIPDITAYFVIIFNVYFLFKSGSFAVFFILSLKKIRTSETINWLRRLQEIDEPDSAITRLKEDLANVEKITPEELNKQGLNKYSPLLRWFYFRFEKAKVKRFIKSEIRRQEEIKARGTNFDWKELHHLVIIPHWKEPIEVLRKSLERLKQSNYPTNRISIVLGAEARDPNGLAVSEQLKSEFEQYFENIWVSNHELGAEEIIGKSSNMAFAGKFARAKIAELGWDLQKVTVTSCDADSQLPSDYFANLSYLYVTEDDAVYKFYTGAMLLYANLHRLPFYARVKNSMSSIYNVGRLMRTDKLVPFSTYSTSFRLIDQIGYWTPYVTPEDFHIFFKSFFKFPAKVSTIPIYQRIMADAAEGENHLETIKNNYFQERRWSWGISDDGWVIKNVLKLIRDGKITLNILYRSIHVVFDHVMGPVSSIIILFGGNIPLQVNPRFAGTVLGNNLPQISSFMIQLTVWFLFISIIFDQYLKPKSEKKVTLFTRILSMLEFVVQPLVGFLLVAVPGIEAHTRLLFGRYLEYYLTKKKS